MLNTPSPGNKAEMSGTRGLKPALPKWKRIMRLKERTVMNNALYNNEPDAVIEICFQIHQKLMNDWKPQT